MKFERVQAVLLFKLNLRRNPMRSYPNKFPEMTASSQNVLLLNCPHGVVKQRDIKPLQTITQNYKLCIDEVMLL